MVTLTHPAERTEAGSKRTIIYRSMNSTNKKSIEITLEEEVAKAQKKMKKRQCFTQEVRDTDLLK